MILFVWVYSLPFCGNMIFYSPSNSKINFRSLVIPFFEAFGVGGYIPEGFLTACSYDYLDTSPENYYFIFIYAIVGGFKLFHTFFLIARHVLAGCVFPTSTYHRILLHPYPSCGYVSNKNSVEQRQKQNRAAISSHCHGNRWFGELSALSCQLKLKYFLFMTSKQNLNTERKSFFRISSCIVHLVRDSAAFRRVAREGVTKKLFSPIVWFFI